MKFSAIINGIDGGLTLKVNNISFCFEYKCYFFIINMLKELHLSSSYKTVEC